MPTLALSQFGLRYSMPSNHQIILVNWLKTADITKDFTQFGHDLQMILADASLIIESTLYR
jgi:hypothetical protein